MVLYEEEKNPSSSKTKQTQTFPQFLLKLYDTWLLKALKF